LNLYHRAFADAAVADIQAVLLAMRKPGLAAKVGLLQPGEGKKPTPSRQGLSAVAPPPQQDYVQHAPQHQAQPEWQQQPLAEATPPGAQFEQKMPIALDGSNIAWRHGVSRRFSIRGVAEALAYFTQRGHPCVVFLPEGRLRDPPRAPESGDALPEGELEAFNALKALEGSPVLVLTPEKDYDDCYITHFAREYQAVVVSNDRFEDQVYQAEAEGSDAAEEWRQWIAACRLPFTFHGHAFVPNPVFSMERAALVANDLSRQASSDPRRP
jgi:Zc3h12a-like Ribonuclease NYN domain